MVTRTASRRVRTHTDTPETADLFRRVIVLRSGPERDVLRDELIRAWLPVAHRIASRFRDRGEPIDDLRQVAAMGLVKALNRYDPDRGPFLSYAVPTVTGELRRHFRDLAWDVRLPRRLQEIRNTVRLARRELTQKPGAHEPTVQQLAALTGLSEQDVTDGLGALECYQALSLDAETESGSTKADTLGVTESGFDLVADRLSVKVGLSHLPQREKTILYLRFFEDLTQTRIAEIVGLSQMHVSRLIDKSCKRVRDEVDEVDEVTDRPEAA